MTVSKNRLNLGWLMLETERDAQFQLAQDGQIPIPQEVLQRAILVPDRLFPRLVNDNLEVRTSVSIDPATGAAAERALFTYEALPRSTVFWFSITYNHPKFFRIQDHTPEPQVHGQAVTVQQVVEKGLAQFEHLGIGGMSTRGMGRFKIFLAT